MNLLEMLNEEIKDKHFTKEEQMRYIYLRTCEIFSFDSRYYYTELFPEVDIKSIINYVPRVTNIKRREIVCKSYSIFILQRLLRELAGIDANSKVGVEHTYVTAKLNNDEYILDATMYDLARVKLGLATTGYKRKQNTNNENYMKELDKEIGYIKNNYKDYSNTLKDLNEETLNKYKINYSDIYRKIATLLESYPNSTKSYSDIIYLIDKLSSGLLPVSSPNIRNDFFKNNQGSLSRIYKVINNNTDYFLLDKEEDNYTLKEIKQEDYKKLTKNLDYLKIT